MEIPKAKAADFQKATQRVYHGSTLTMPVEWGTIREIEARSKK
jgi:hypothetical protein